MPERARKAIAQLTHQDTDGDSSPGVFFLADIRAIFDRRGVEVLARISHQ